MKSKKTLALILALMMIISCVPMYASAAEALSTSNVTTWPTVSYKSQDGKMYYGQSCGDIITINDDEVVTDASGNQVAGHFEFIDPSEISGATQKYRANLKFVPDDESTYTGFDAKRCRYVTFAVEKTTPVPADENDIAPVATEVEAGSTLSTSILSGAKYINPYNSSEPNILAKEWVWSDSGATVINNSGYYKAELSASNYNIVEKWVLVRVKGDTSEIKMATSIEELPTTSVVTVGDKLSSIVLTGGKAVGMNGVEVSGKFAFRQDYTISYAGTITPTLVFTPDDERYSPATAAISVTVEKAPFKFIDENGNEIVPEIAVDPSTGAKMGDVEAALKGLTMNTTENIYFRFEDGVKNTDYAVPGTYNVTVRSYEDNSSFLETTLPIRVVYNTVELTPTFKPGYLKSAVDCGDYKPTGTFTVSLDGKEIATVKANEEFTYTVENSGDHVLSAKYTPAENDYFIIADATQTVNVKLNRTLNRINCNSAGFISVPCGDTVTLSANANAENFDGWAITDAQGNTVDLGVDLTALNITFTMPDHDLNIEAKVKSTSSGDSGLDIDLPDIDLELPEFELDAEGDHKFKFVNIIQNLIEMLKNFIKQIGQTIEGIL